MLSSGLQIFYPLVHTKLYQELYDHQVCQEPHHWCEIFLYQEMLLGKQEITPNSSAQNVDEIIKSVLPLMKRWQFKETRGEWKYEPEKKMYLLYQDSLRVCFTRELEPGMGRSHTYDLYAIDASTLDLPLEIYDHKVGGLIEQLGKKYVLQITKTEIEQL